MPMRLKTYKKEFDYSYTLGILPTIELILKKPALVTEVIFSKPAVNNIDFSKLDKLCQDNYIDLREDTYLVGALAQKDNTTVIGVFKKFTMSLEQDKNHVLLYKPTDIGNLGMIIRSSVGFNRPNIGIIDNAVDCFNPKVIRASMGAFFSCNIEYFADLQSYLRKYGNHIYAFDIKAKETIDNLEYKKLNSFLFGTEGDGLPDSILNQCSTVKIKFDSNSIESLNLANAVSIALYSDFVK